MSLFEDINLLYLLFFTVSILFSIVLNSILIRFSRNLGVRENNGELIRWNENRKPSLGGISFFIVFLFSFIFYAIFIDSENIFKNKQLLGVIFTLSLAFLMGLSDDAYNTRPFLKFFIQIACGVILIYTDNYIRFFYVDWLNYLITIVWVVGMMNSINMLDNMDAITTLVSSFIIVGAILAYKFTTLIILDANFIILLAVLGSLIGFLRFNWNPSKIFMGDTGSQFIGLFLAIVGIQYFWNYETDGMVIAQTKQIICVLLVFMLPIIDTSVVVINRLSRGQSPFVGGKDHTTHCLYYAGFNERQVALIFSLLGLISIFFLFLIFEAIERWSYYHAVLFLLYFLAVFAYFFYLSRKHKDKYID